MAPHDAVEPAQLLQQLPANKHNEITLFILSCDLVWEIWMRIGSEVDSMSAAMLTVSPKTEKCGILEPTTPPTQLPVWIPILICILYCGMCST